MPTLFLKCRTCGTEFPTPIALTNESFQGNVLISGLEHACPACGSRDQFFTADYFLPKSGMAISNEAPAPTPVGVAATATGSLPIETPAPLEAATATIGGDPTADEKTQLDTMAGRLAGYGIRAGPGNPTEAPLPPHDSDAGQ
jgi:DNA-directed RNA polymerase subunit RPC12/RpoP